MYVPLIHPVVDGFISVIVLGFFLYGVWWITGGDETK